MSEAAAEILGAVDTSANSKPQVQTPTVEQTIQPGQKQVPNPKTAAATPPAEDPKITSKLNVLMQREKAALEIERRAKQLQTDMDTRIKALEEREKRVKEFESVKDTNPLKALELLNLDYSDLTNVAVNDGNITPDIQIKKLSEKIENLTKSQEADKEKQARDAKAAEEQKIVQATTEFKNQINTFIKDNKTKYELTTFEGQESLVYDVIDEHYNRTVNKETGVGEIMKIADAADKVEAWLEKKDEERRKLDKIKSKLGPQPGQYVVNKPDMKIPVQKQMRTLTNQQSATQTRPSARILSDDERVAKAIAYARGLRAG